MEPAAPVGKATLGSEGQRRGGQGTAGQARLNGGEDTKGTEEGKHNGTRIYERERK